MSGAESWLHWAGSYVCSAESYAMELSRECVGLNHEYIIGLNRECGLNHKHRLNHECRLSFECHISQSYS